MEVQESIAVLVSLPERNPEFIGLMLALVFMLVVSNNTRQGRIDFFAVVCGAAFIPYFSNQYGQNDYRLIIIISLLTPILISFVLIHIVENRRLLGKVAFDNLCKAFPFLKVFKK